MVCYTWLTNHHNMEYWHSSYSTDSDAKVQKQVRHMGCQEVSCDVVSRSEARKILLGADKHNKKSIAVMISNIFINSFIKLQSTMSYSFNGHNVENTTEVETV